MVFSKFNCEDLRTKLLLHFFFLYYCRGNQTNRAKTGLTRHPLMRLSNFKQQIWNHKMMIVLCRWTRGCPSTVYDIFFLSVPQQQESNTNKSFSNHSYSVTMMMMMMPTHGNLLSPEDKKWFMLPFCSSQSILRFDGRRR